MKQQKLFLLSLVTISIILSSCKDKGTDPPPGKPLKHPREMTWTADTLEMPDYAIQLLPQDLLVISPTDIWLAAWVGHGQVYHYDGVAWKMVKEIGGGIGCLTKGTGSSIWAGGYIGRDVSGQFTQNAYIGYYNGTSWQDNEFNIQSEILDMNTDTEGNIWACGRNGLVMKYENSNWIADTIKVGYKQNHPEVEYFLRNIEEFNGEQRVIGWIDDVSRLRNIYYYIVGGIDNWGIRDSIVSDSQSSIITFGNWGFHKIGNEKLYSYGAVGIWEMGSVDWNKIYNHNSEIYNMSGPSKDYLLAVSAFRTVLFYNGSRWERIEDLLNVNDPYFSFSNVWTDGYEIIIAGYTFQDFPQRTIIWHGK